MDKLSRRDFLRMSALTAAGAVLAACQPAQPPADEPAAEEEAPEPVEEAPPEEPVVVQYWFGWGGTYAGQTWDALVETDEFKEAIGNNTIETKGGLQRAGGTSTNTRLAEYALG